MERGELVLAELPFVVVQSCESSRTAAACLQCLRLVGSLGDQLRHTLLFTEQEALVPDQLPLLGDDAGELGGEVPCRFAHAGCEAVFCSEACRDLAEIERAHAVLCEGRSAAACAFAELWSTTYETFHLGGMTLARLALSGPGELGMLASLVCAPWWTMLDADDDATPAERRELAAGAFDLVVRALDEAEARGVRLGENCAAGRRDAWLTVDVFGSLLGALRLNLVGVDYMHPAAEYFSLLALDDAAAQEIRPLALALRHAYRLAAAADNRASDGNDGALETELQAAQDAALPARVLAERLANDVPSVHGSGLFPSIAMINHSCLPNASVEFDSGSCRASVILLKPVACEAELTFCYVDADLALAERTAALAEYGFECDCPRCAAERATSKA